jgi:hypothetical protein
LDLDEISNLYDPKTQLRDLVIGKEVGTSWPARVVIVIDALECGDLYALERLSKYFSNSLMLSSSSSLAGMSHLLMNSSKSRPKRPEST